MSSPVPSPVPAGTERDEWLMRDALRKIEVICGEAWSYRVPHDLASDVLRQLSVVGALLPPLAAVVSSSPATPEGEGVQVMLDLADGSRVVGVLGQHYEPPYYFWDDEAASSPATPEGWVCRDHGATMMCPEGCKTYRPREAWAAAPPASPDEVTYQGLAHKCDNPECHVAGFVATLSRSDPLASPASPAETREGRAAAGQAAAKALWESLPEGAPVVVEFLGSGPRLARRTDIGWESDDGNTRTGCTPWSVRVDEVYVRADHIAAASPAVSLPGEAERP